MLLNALHLIPFALLNVRRLWLFTVCTIDSGGWAAYFYFKMGQRTGFRVRLSEGALLLHQLPESRSLSPLPPAAYPHTHTSPALAHSPPRLGQASDSENIESGGEAGHHPLLLLELRKDQCAGSREASVEKSTAAPRVAADAAIDAASVVWSALGGLGVACGSPGAARTMRVRVACAMSHLWRY